MDRKHLVGATLILLLLAGVGWAYFSGEDAEVAAMKQKRDDMLNNIDNMSLDETRSAREGFRQQMQGLSQSQRREIGRGFRDFMMQRMRNLLAMPPEQQIVAIDKLIDRMEAFRGDRENRGPRSGGDQSSAARDQRQKQRLDRTSPDQRALMDQVKDLINQRRGDRGLEPMKGGRPPFGGPPPFGRPR